MLYKFPPFNLPAKWRLDSKIQKDTPSTTTNKLPIKINTTKKHNLAFLTSTFLFPFPINHYSTQLSSDYDSDCNSARTTSSVCLSSTLLTMFSNCSSSTGWGPRPCTCTPGPRARFRYDGGVTFRGAGWNESIVGLYILYSGRFVIVGGVNPTEHATS